MPKLKEEKFVREDGVTVTILAPRSPRKSEVTWPIDKSKHSVWHQGVSNYVRGTRGTQGTVEHIGQ